MPGVEEIEEECRKILRNSPEKEGLKVAEKIVYQRPKKLDRRSSLTLLPRLYSRDNPQDVMRDSGRT